MYSFRNDYSELCHEKVLSKLASINRKQFEGYGEDEITLKVKNKIKSLLNNNNVDVYFISGGTQTNLVSISSILKPYQAVLSADSGHIATHEAGAIESTGHKIITLKPNNTGKIKASQISQIMDNHFKDEAREHTPQPAMVYISNPTEFGSIYKYKELKEIKEECEKNNIPLYIDGARLSQALASEKSDIKFSDLVNLCDMFYLGGTKNGAIFGECLVVINDNYKKDFRYNLKQKGALMAKGFSIALQFEALFENNLFLELGKKANYNAKYIVEELTKMNIPFLVEQESNQIFPILNNTLIDKLREKYLFYNWQVIDEYYCAIRLCISWATEKDIIKEFINDVKINI